MRGAPAIAYKLSTAVEAGVAAFLLTLLGTVARALIWQVTAVVPFLLGAWWCANIRPDFWYVSLVHGETYLEAMGLADMLILFMFGLWIRALQTRGTVPDAAGARQASR
jgi:hypothetical protein